MYFPVSHASFLRSSTRGRRPGRTMPARAVRRTSDSPIAAPASADPPEREKAANALIAVRDPACGGAAARGARRSRGGRGVRGQAALAIGSLGCRRAVPRLLELTRDPDWFVGWPPLNALGYIDLALPAEPAAAALGDDEPLVRQAAALTIGDSKDPIAVDLLVEALLHDRDGPYARRPPTPSARSATRGRRPRSVGRAVSGGRSSAGGSSRPHAGHSARSEPSIRASASSYIQATNGDRGACAGPAVSA
jgi:hypothetical protein